MRLQTTCRQAEPRLSAQTTTRCPRRRSSSPDGSPPQRLVTRTVSGWWSNSVPWTSRKNRSERSRSRLQRATPLPLPNPRLRVRTGLRRHDEAATSAAAHLPPLSPCVARFVRGPLVSCSFLVRSAAPLAGDFPLLF